MTEAQRILLLTWTPPGDRNVGEIILRDLCSLLPESWVHVLEVSNFPESQSRYRHTRLAAPSETPWRPLPGRLGGLLNHIRVRTSFRRAADQLVPKIVEYARENKIDKIWITLSSQALIRIGSLLPLFTRIPVFSLVWDPPAFLARHQNWDSSSVGWSLKNFDAAMRGSSAAMVVSDAMVAEYSKRYSIPCTVVRHAFLQTPHDGVEPSSRSDTIGIGFAGTLYDQSQLDCLLGALNRLNWRIHGRDVRLRMIGNFYRFTKLAQPARVELLGWRSTEETRQLLGQCDFTYLPVSFLPHFAEFARLAFPTKLSTFLAARRPVLVHAPDYAAPSSFCRELGFGTVCSSMVPDDLAKALVAVSSQESRVSLMRGVDDTSALYFSRDVMRRQFAKFLDIAETVLGS